MKEMKTLTVFTPTFNRAECLRRCYESLLRQTCRDFVWLVVDDGSSDGTADLVREWQRAGHLEIRYHYQENGGMHTAHNAAYRLMDTELNVCLDSDDLMTEDAVASLLELWKRLRQRTAGRDCGAGRLTYGPENSSERLLKRTAER